MDFGLKRPKEPKMSLKRLHDNNKLYILDGTKHDSEKFGILNHSKVVDILHFEFYRKLNTLLIYFLLYIRTSRPLKIRIHISKIMGR